MNRKFAVLAIGLVIFMVVSFSPVFGTTTDNSTSLIEIKTIQ